MKSNQDGLQCDGCMNWFHRKCESMSRSTMNHAKSDEEWFVAVVPYLTSLIVSLIVTQW